MSRIFLLTLILVSFVLKSQDIKSIHLLNYNNDQDLMDLSSKLEGFAQKGINTIFLEVDYHYNFKSYPELRQTDNVITKKAAQKFVQIANDNGIEIIPQFQCVGHQSWKKNTWKCYF